MYMYIYMYIYIYIISVVFYINFDGNSCMCINVVFNMQKCTAISWSNDKNGVASMDSCCCKCYRLLFTYFFS